MSPSRGYPLSTFSHRFDYLFFETSLVGIQSAQATPSPEAVVDVAELDLLWGVSHGSGRVLEERFLLFGAHQPEQSAGLRVVIVIVFTMAPVAGCAFEAQRRFRERGLLLPLAVAVGLVAEGATVVVVHTHGAVAMVAMDRAAGAVDRDQVMVDAKSIALGITVGEEPAL